MDLNEFVKELNAVMQPIVAAPLVAAGSSVVEEKKDSVPVGSTIKLLIVSTHPNQINGYSKVVHQLLHQLEPHSAWLHVTVFGTQKIINGDIGRTIPEAFRVMDATALEKEKEKSTGFAFSELPVVIQSEKPDVVMIYNDLSVICTYVESIRKTIENRAFKIWAYVDMTYLAPSPQMMDVLNRDVERIFVFTRSWKDTLKSHGITRPMDVMPHGVNTKMFRTVPRDMARQLLGLPKDMFLFTSVNKNIPRKRLDLLVMAFTTLIVRFPMKPIFLLVVGDNGTRGGFSLLDIFARELKINGGSVDMFGNRLLITSKDSAYKDEDINMLYNAGDAGVSCAEGEGFGLCALEQMAVGVPQIVPEIHGYTEYCTAENALMVKPTVRGYLPQAYSPMMGEAQIVNPEEVAKAMERYVFTEELRKRHGKEAKKKADEYTWEKAVAPLIKRLQAVATDDE